MPSVRRLEAVVTPRQLIAFWTIACAYLLVCAALWTGVVLAVLWVWP